MDESVWAWRLLTLQVPCKWDAAKQKTDEGERREDLVGDSHLRFDDAPFGEIVAQLPISRVGAATLRTDVIVNPQAI